MVNRQILTVFGRGKVSLKFQSPFVGSFLDGMQQLAIALETKNVECKRKKGVEQEVPCGRPGSVQVPHFLPLRRHRSRHLSVVWASPSQI